MIPREISHYRILKKLGAGGMGEVYLAEDAKLHRKVALKFLPSEVAGNSERMRRFVQEARAAATLNHANIAHVYEIGEANGQSFIAMEYVDGQTLQQRITQAPIETDEIVQISINIAKALEEAHTSAITHRDIKPSNIMVTSRGEVKVLDFGLAKIRTASSDYVHTEMPTQIKTRPGILLGTVEYMSPEQALGREVDHRTDLFSLGVVMYEMATGRRPFVGSTVIETVDRILHSIPNPVRASNEQVPLELERIIRKCLEKDRDNRYQSAHELAIDLQNLKRDSQAPTVSYANRKRRSLRLIPPYVYALVAVTLILLGAGIFWWISRNKTIDSVAVLPFTNVGTDTDMEYLSQGISENLINRLSLLPDLRVVPRSTAFRYKDVDPQAAGSALGVRAVIVGRVVQRGDTLNVQAELIDVANESQLWGAQFEKRPADLITIQEEIARAVAERLRLRLTEAEQRQLARRPTESAEANQLYLKGRYFWNKRSEDGIRKGIDYFRQAIDIDPTYSLAHAGLADAYNFLGAFGIGVLPAAEAMPKAKAAAVDALKIDDSLAEAHTSLAFVKLYYDWDWLGAEREFQRAIELSPNYAPAHQWYSHLLMATGRTSDSIQKAKRATDIDPLSLAANMNVGWQYHWAKEYKVASDWLRKTLEMDQNFEQAHWGLGLAYEGMRMFDEATSEFQKASALSNGSPVYVAALGHAYASGGKAADARRVATELEERAKREYVPPYWMATLYVGLGDKEHAFSWLEKAFEERSGGLVWLNVDPRMDSLRSDPRFAALKNRVGLPQ